MINLIDASFNVSMFCYLLVDICLESQFWYLLIIIDFLTSKNM